MRAVIIVRRKIRLTATELGMAKKLTDAEKREKQIKEQQITAIVLAVLGVIFLILSITTQQVALLAIAIVFVAVAVSYWLESRRDDKKK